MRDEADAAGVVFVGGVVHTLRGGKRTDDRLLLIVHRDTVFCEGPSGPLNHVFMPAPSISLLNRSREAGRAAGAVRPESPEIEIYATNQEDGK